MKLFRSRLLLFSFLAVAGFALPMRADVVSVALSSLPPYTVNELSEPRVDVLSVEFGDQGTDLVGLPGQAVGWSFKIKWASNAGDVLIFNGSTLEPAHKGISTEGYVDLIGQVGGNSDGVMLADTEWASPSPFNPATHGIGYLTLANTAEPGNVFRGTLRLEFKVYTQVGETLALLNNFSLPVEVSVTVGAIELTTQTITFPEIANKAITAASFALGATSDSGLPIEYISLNPDLCTVENGLATVHGAGEVAIVAIQPGDTRYAAADSVTRFFEITKTPATVEINGELEQNYTNTDKLFTAVTAPTGLPIKWLYNGVEAPPREPGIYIIDAVIDDPAYEGQARARLTITDNSPAPLVAYANWLLTHFTPSEIQAGLVTARTVDLNADGVTNLFKYALGLDPWTTMTAEERAALPRFVRSGDANGLVFSLPTTAAGDIAIAVEASSDLTTWTEVARRVRGGEWTGTASVFTGTPDATGLRAETLVTEPAVPVHPNRFYRLKIEFIP